MSKFVFLKPKGTIIAATLALAASNSFALAGADWASPATTLAESLQSGTVSIATAIIGFGLILYGIYIIVSGHFDIRRVLTYVLGGALIMVGPTLMTTLLTATS
ncbi:TrbC/VirB2 family protein [Cohaesibacter celericrescens]|uniref:Conjugal transfer protein TrbC n=1 Tax=Cohaesibacter celericrescens TaxID=2067669 RepID=A0A2N5XRU4_9HYPH|nr:TrbC/VirB2 family protein [Cohaesibacter celericrescens]PLW77180.1 hypothetical protein C0081_10935 [Cohaesibacter celericrescens]